jgi:hypothetical protein
LPPGALEVVEAAVQSLPPAMGTPLSCYMNAFSLVTMTDDCQSYMGTDYSIEEVRCM